MTAVELSKLQQEDKSLEAVHQAANGEMTIDQLVLPSSCRKVVHTAWYEGKDWKSVCPIYFLWYHNHQQDSSGSRAVGHIEGDTGDK